MATFKKIEGVMTPEVTVFHKVNTSIAAQITGTAETFYPAGSPVMATDDGAGNPINFMGHPTGTVDGVDATISGLTAHDIAFGEETVASAAVVISGVFYTENLPVVLTEPQMEALTVQGLIRYGVPVPKK